MNQNKASFLTSKRPSMKDVADLAGVSRTTVSFVLNDKPGANIPPSTRKRIWDAVETLGYRPNALARGLRAQSTQTIGFLSDVIATTPFAGRMLQGAQSRAWEEGKLLLAINTDGDPAIKRAGVEKLLERQVDGIIYATMYHREVNPPQALREVPAVLLDCFVHDQSLPSVVPDETQGGYNATRHLIERGHRHIAYIGDRADVPARRGRLSGYRHALAEAGIPYDKNLVREGNDSRQQIGYTLAKSLFETDAIQPTAIFCYNDRMAMGAYDALRQLNLKIPDDVAIIGFDNQDLIAADLMPGLTTMALPHHEMGTWAVDQLLTLVTESQSSSIAKSTSIQHKIGCQLVERQST